MFYCIYCIVFSSQLWMKMHHLNTSSVDISLSVFNKACSWEKTKNKKTITTNNNNNFIYFFFFFWNYFLNSTLYRSLIEIPGNLKFLNFNPQFQAANQSKRSYRIQSLVLLG